MRLQEKIEEQRAKFEKHAKPEILISNFFRVFVLS